MNKKYNIVNFKNSDSFIDYLFYIIIILFLIIYLIYITYIYEIDNNIDTILIKSNNIENFNNNIQQKDQKIPTIEKLKKENEDLLSINNNIEKKLTEQSRALFLSKNYNKIKESSFNNEINFIDADFNSTGLPEIDISEYNVIKTSEDLTKLINSASEFKNIYKVGEVVENPSSYNISKNDICYHHFKDKLSNDPAFEQKYPKCAACKLNNKDWTTTETKTNIEKICLFNPDASEQSGILNLEGCRKICEQN
jgi:hypothetical protein